MEERNTILNRKLNSMYQAEVAALISMVLVVVPFINLIALILMVVAAVISISALVGLWKIHGDYQNAVVMVVIGFVLALLGQGDGVVAEIFGMAASVVSLLQTFFIVRATNSLLREVGREDVSLLGDKVWKLSLVNCVVSLSCSILTLVFLPAALMGLVVALIISVVTMVLYIKYLKRSSQAFA